MIRTNQINHKSTTFLRILIYFYRILGITFGGTSFDKNGYLINSPFWLYYGWFGCFVYFCLMVFFVISSMNQQTVEQLKKINNGTFLYYMIVVIWPIIGLTVISSLAYTNQKFGFKILNIFSRYSLTEFRKLKSVKIVLFLLSMASTITFVVQSSVYDFQRNFISSFINNFVFIPLFTSIISVSWMVSIGFSENIKIVRKYLDKNMLSIQLTEANKFVLINYKNIKKIDQYLALNHILLVTGIVVTIMSNVYIWIFARKTRFLMNLLEFNTPTQMMQFISFILSCFFLGKFSIETEKLLNHLDNLSINISDSQIFKALILFRTSVEKAKCGFTVGGFAPWNMLTLLQVTCYSFRIL